MMRAARHFPRDAVSPGLTARHCSIRHAVFAQQPRVHDLPFVPASRLEIQQRRSRILQLKKKLKRIPRARLVGIDGTRLAPAVPLRDNQRPCFPLFHSTHARLNYETFPRGQRSGKMIMKSFPRMKKDGCKSRESGVSSRPVRLESATNASVPQRAPLLRATGRVTSTGPRTAPRWLRRNPPLYRP